MQWQTPKGSIFCAMILAGALALPALSYESQIIFEHKSWKVDIHGWDDGDIACRAIVGSERESFAIWIFQSAEIQLQFFSTSWNFGAEQYADLQVQIDRKDKWDLTNAHLSENSVQFTLPGNDAAVNFVTEIARGNTLFLRSANGKDVQNYSLAGSKASISTLMDCGTSITAGGGSSGGSTASNPFN